jgi:integrase
VLTVGSLHAPGRWGVRQRDSAARSGQAGERAEAADRWRQAPRPHVVVRGKRRGSTRPRLRALLDSIDTGNVAGLRDRALIALMVYSFARIGMAVGMAVEDVYTQNRRLWMRLREKGGKRHAMPCRHHNLEEYLTAYLDGAVLRDDAKGPLFRTIGRGTRQADAHDAVLWPQAR